MKPHTPVLLREVLEVLGVKNGEFVIDGTIDGGGHAEALLAGVGKHGRLLGIDRDPDMLVHSKVKFREAKNVALKLASYADIPNILREDGSGKADALLLDLGFSSLQLEEAGRGFSFLRDEPLLMTYDPSEKPLAEILRGLSENELADIIFSLGGERMSKRIAKAIREEGRQKPITTTGKLAEVIRNALPRNYERGRIDPATRTFQALRIYANKELEHLTRALEQIPEVMASGGRVAIITFHSLEDGIVKRKFMEMAKEEVVEFITKKPIIPNKEEIYKNNRSRSAKLRAVRVK